MAFDDESLTVALISDVFHTDDGLARLEARLAEARERGALLAILPEIPLNPWSPATQIPIESDAEAPGGPRHLALAEAAREAEIAVIGGAIVRDPESGRRRSTALAFDVDGTLLGAYQKLHIPEEPGFWETSHYEPGVAHPKVIEVLGFPLGIQICSDNNRPEGTHILAGLGAEAVVVPRSTELATYQKWRVIFQANALTSGLYVLSVNRPGPEDGVLIGGPSVVFDPEGRVVLETTEPVGIARLSRHAVRAARVAYPGYLPVRADIYAAGWSAVMKAALEKEE